MTLIDKAEALAILAPSPNAKDGLWAKRKQALYDAIDALPARGVPEATLREAHLREAAAAVRARYMGDNNREDQEVLRCEAAVLALIGERP